MLGDKARLYLEDEVIASLVVPVNERPDFPRLYAYATDNFFDPPNAQLKHMVYAPISLTEETKAVRFNPSIMKVIKNVKITTILEPHNEFELAFKFFPTTTSRSISSILRLAADSSGSLDTAFDHSAPMIGLYPDSYNLILNYGSATNQFWQYPAVLVPKFDNLIKMIALDDNIMLYVNNIYIGSLPYPLVNRPLYERLFLFVSDNVHNAAQGIVSYVSYTPLHENKIAKRFLKVSTIAPKSKYNRVGHFDQIPTSEYVISAVLTPWKLKSNNGYSIFRFTSKSDANNDKTAYGSRCPMLHYKSSTNKKVGMSIVSQNQDGSVKHQSIGFKENLPDKEEVSVTLVSINNKISLYVNGVLVDSATAPLVERPPFARLYVFTSTSYQQFFDGVLQQLEYTPLYKSNQILLQPGNILRLKKDYRIGKF